MFADALIVLIVEAINELGGARNDVESVSVFNAGGRSQYIIGIYDDATA